MTVNVQKVECQKMIQTQIYNTLCMESYMMRSKIAANHLLQLLGRKQHPYTTNMLLFNSFEDENQQEDTENKIKYLTAIGIFKKYEHFEDLCSLEAKVFSP